MAHPITRIRILASTFSMVETGAATDMAGVGIMAGTDITADTAGTHIPAGVAGTADTDNGG
jgi:hypothetical protein